MFGLQHGQPGAIDMSVTYTKGLLRRSLVIAAACLLLASFAKPSYGIDYKAARGLEPDLENGKKIYALCIGCHQPEGWGSPATGIPQIAGQHPRVIVRQLEHFAKGYRQSPEMNGIVNSGIFESEQSVADVAGYISRLPVTPNPSHGNGQNLVRGEALFNAACGSRCHGRKGEGRDYKLWPRLQGQHYEYLVRQMKLFLEGERRFADNLMISRLSKFSEEDIEAVADYLSRVTPDPEDAPPALEASPDVYKVLAEDDQWRILEATWQPGQEDNFHFLPADRVSLFKTDCNLRLIEPDGTFREFKQQADSATTHSDKPIGSRKVKNIGDKACVMQIVELK